MVKKSEKQSKKQIESNLLSSDSELDNESKNVVDELLDDENSESGEEYVKETKEKKPKKETKENKPEKETKEKKPENKLKKETKEKILSPYNLFMKEEMILLKDSHSELTHKERFAKAAKNWKDSDKNPKNIIEQKNNSN